IRTPDDERHVLACLSQPDTDHPPDGTRSDDADFHDASHKKVALLHGSVTRPPLAASVSPVMKLDSSLSRKRITAAISSGWPIRPIGVPAIRRFAASSESARAISVSIRPGATQLTRTLWGANASAQQRVKAITPALEVA